jgi:hypothetical protein
MYKFTIRAAMGSVTCAADGMRVDATASLRCLNSVQNEVTLRKSEIAAKSINISDDVGSIFAYSFVNFLECIS